MRRPRRRLTNEEAQACLEAELRRLADAYMELGGVLTLEFGAKPARPRMASPLGIMLKHGMIGRKAAADDPAADRKRGLAEQAKLFPRPAPRQ